MSISSFKVSITPQKAYDLLKNHENADLVYEEFTRLENGLSTGTLIYEKYYMRTSNRAALVIMIDDFKGNTEVRAVATGSSQGMFFNFDWGAADSFASSVERILENYIVK